MLSPELRPGSEARGVTLEGLFLDEKAHQAAQRREVACGAARGEAAGGEALQPAADHPEVHGLEVIDALGGQEGGEVLEVSRVRLDRVAAEPALHTGVVQERVEQGPECHGPS